MYKIILCARMSVQAFSMKKHLFLLKVHVNSLLLDSVKVQDSTTMLFSFADLFEISYCLL